MGQEDPTEYIERTDYGFSLKITTTRGTGTRDQERVEFKGKVREYEEAVEFGEAAIEQLDEWASELRDVQP